MSVFSRSWRGTVGQLIVSVGCALAVVAIASRVNRPARLAIVHEVPRAADLVLADVRWDPNSFRSAMESIQRAAPGVVEVDWKTLGELDAPADPRYPRPVVRLRNVRVGTLLHLSADPFRDEGLPAFHVERGRIVVRGAEASPQRVTTRLYDLRRILGPIADDDAWENYGESMAEFVREMVFNHPAFGDLRLNWSAGGCGGWLFVNTTDECHRAVEELLLLIGRGDWPDDNEAGAR